jgi:protoporphyrinogen oxidase
MGKLAGANSNRVREMNSTRTLILGGGMSGLSCAYHSKSDYRLVERSDEPGGLSRSIKHEGFIFDHTGHLLHLRNPYTLKLIPELLGENLALHQRNAWIHSHGADTRYPFQANTHGLPARVVKECVHGFVEAQLRALPEPKKKPESLRSWVLRTFGTGFAKHFFFPYNQKLWTVSPDVLSAEWVAPFVPRPSVEEILAGALTDQTKKFGYNASFYYPKEGGIQALAFAFARSLKNVHLNTAAETIDLARKEVTLSNGDVVRYEHLVTTLPLAKFLQIAKPLPPEIEKLKRQLRWSSVYNINLGIDRPQISDKHWIYFPEKKYRFYRVGFPMNFADTMTPPGCSSMYVEIAYTPGRPPNDAEALRQSLKGLRECGLLTARDKIVTTKVLHIPVAYVTYDKNRTPASQKILSFLETQNVHSIGRFGAWKYSYMEEAILDGKSTAEKLA